MSLARLSLSRLRLIIQEAFKTRVIDTSSKKTDDIEKRMGSIEAGRRFSNEQIEEEIEELQSMPEFDSLEAFIQTKLDDDDFSYRWVEMQALARNAAAQRLGKKRTDVVASSIDVEKVRNFLEKEMGLKLIAREIPKTVRGATDNPNGTSPFAGMGGGGSGFGSDRQGGTFTSFGGGPGAIGGKYDWHADDKKNFSMGARRTR